MRQIFTFLLILIGIYSAYGQIPKSVQIQYNGLYQTVGEIDKEDNDTTYSFLRFYPDGTIIYVAAEGTVHDLKDWFHLKFEGASVGKYEIHGKRIYFSTTSKVGTIIYQGKINDQHKLTLKWRSLINGARGREKFYFIEVNNLK